MSRIILPSLAALALVACGGSDPAENTAPTEAPSAPSTTQDSAPAETAAAAPAVESAQAPAEAPAQPVQAAVEDVEDHSATLAALGENFIDADLGNGARQYRRCQACHTLNEGGRHTVGPNLHGIFNSEAAQKEGFGYSSQLASSGLVWDIETLDAWIENPRAMVPGNRMSFVGLRDADKRRDVIAYMIIESSR